MTADDTNPWYNRGLIGKVTKGVLVLVLGASFAWAGSMLMAASQARAQAKENQKKIKEVKTTQRTLQNDLLPALEGVERELDNVQKSIDRLFDERRAQED